MLQVNEHFPSAIADRAQSLVYALTKGQVNEMLLIKDLKLIPPFKQMKIRLFTSSIVGFTDNHAAHHVAGVEEIIEATGALLLYLPP